MIADGDSLNKEVWQRLVNRESLKALSLPEKDGRIDLRGFRLPEPVIVKRWQTPLANVTQIEPPEVFYKTRLHDLDFSGGRLNSLRFYESEIINCRFDQCQLKDLRLWATIIRDCTFRGADLRDSALGVATMEEGPVKGRRNRYAAVDFTGADLRGTVYVAASFERCTFRDAKLGKINFATSTFVDCKFEGEIREVLFWRSDLFTRPDFPENAFPPNEMLDVDFSQAKLRWVEFRGLKLDRVRLPSDREHLVIRDFATVLDRLMDALRQQGDSTAKMLIAVFEGYRKWAPPDATGVLNTHDLTEAGDDAVRRVLELLHGSV